MAVPGSKYLLLFVLVSVSCSIDMWQVLIGSYQELYLLYDTEFVSLYVFIIYFNVLVLINFTKSFLLTCYKLYLECNLSVIIYMKYFK